MNTELFNREGYANRQLEKRLILNSEAIKPGCFLSDEGAAMAKADAVTDKIAGFAVMFFDKYGYPIEHPWATLGTATWAPATKTLTAASDNQTVDAHVVAYMPLRASDEIKVTLDAVKGTTTGSNLPGYNLPILTTDSSLLDESEAVAAETNCQFKIRYATGNTLSTTEVVVTVLPALLQIS